MSNLIQYGLLAQLNVEVHPELEGLLTEDETFADLNAEANLLRWFNYHLKRAGYEQTVKNFSDDIKVSKIVFDFSYIVRILLLTFIF